MGTHLRALSESHLMNTNMTGFGWFSKFILLSCAMEESSLSIGRVNITEIQFNFTTRACPDGHVV